MAVAAHARTPDLAGSTDFVPGRRTCVPRSSITEAAARRGAGLHCARAPGAAVPGGGLR
jgi:hypothetical protein